MFCFAALFDGVGPIATAREEQHYGCDDPFRGMAFACGWLRLGCGKHASSLDFRDGKGADGLLDVFEIFLAER